MKHRLIVAAFTVLTALSCQKQTDSNPRKSLPLVGNEKGIHLTLTGDEQKMLAEVLLKEGIKDSADFVKKVNSVKEKCQINSSFLRHAKNNETLNNETLNNETLDWDGSEELSVADFYSAAVTRVQDWESDYNIMLSQLPGEQYSTNVKVYKATGIREEEFVIRKNRILFSIPYTVAVKGYTNAQILKVRQMDGYPPTMSPVGSYWGTYTAAPGAPAYVQSFGPSSAQVQAQGSETRTEVRAIDGRAQISTNIDLGAFEAGSELEAGFTIESAHNIYNQYILSGSFTIQLLYAGSDSEPAMFNFASALKCQQYGVLKNR